MENDFEIDYTLDDEIQAQKELDEFYENFSKEIDRLNTMTTAEFTEYFNKLNNKEVT